MSQKPMEPESETPPSQQQRERPRMSAAQRKYLSRGLSQPGGKLPLFDEQGQQVSRQTVEACIARGWAERWFANPLKPDWLVCRLTDAGKAALSTADQADSEDGGD